MCDFTEHSEKSPHICLLSELPDPEKMKSPDNWKFVHILHGNT